jgi:signal transduction histidine kinase
VAGIIHNGGSVVVDFLLQLVSLFLVAAGLLFIVIELLVKFDRSILFQGIALVLFGLVPAVDIWVLPHQHLCEDVLLWTRIQHVLMFLLFPIVLWYLKNFLKSDIRYFHHIVIVLAALFSPMFFSDAAISCCQDKIIFGPWYYFLFLPCAALAGSVTVWLIIVKLKNARENERRVLFYHLIGFTLLCAFGFIEVSVNLLKNIFTSPLPNFFIFGVFAFGVMIFLVFTERFLLLVNDRQAAYDQLRVALREMEEASTLRQIGEATSIINHEIKNYLTKISGWAELVKLTETLSDDGKEAVGGIMKTVSDLQNFSLDILQLSRARIVKEQEQLQMVPLLRQCIDGYFPDRRKQIALEASGDGHTARGEWNKLEHVFVNIFKNAFEAGATTLIVRVQSTRSTLLVTVTDNGSGCSAEQRANLFKVFYTTKKGRQGTGLGLAISRAVIESHGGRITAYSQNGLGDGLHGLQINISLPRGVSADDDADGRKPPVVLVNEGIAAIDAVLQIFSNVGVYPLVMKSAEELEKRKDLAALTVVAAESAVRQVRALQDRQIVLLERKDGQFLIRGMAGAVPLRLFSEEFVADKFVMTV